jgi:hypothetical protein
MPTTISMRSSLSQASFSISIIDTAVSIDAGFFLKQLPGDAAALLVPATNNHY